MLSCAAAHRGSSRLPTVGVPVLVGPSAITVDAGVGAGLLASSGAAGAAREKQGGGSGKRDCGDFHGVPSEVDFWLKRTA